jgi:cell division control protein 6
MNDEPVKSGYPSDFYLQWFKDEVERRQFVILILDEVDKFVEHKDSEFNDFFYVISRTVDKVVTIMLTNRASFEANFYSNLDSRVKDTFYFERIEFGDYYANELMDILEDRAQTGWNVGTYDKGIIAQIAKASYDQGLRARGVIRLARMAGEIAETKGHNRIEEQDVRQATDQWTKEHDLDIIRRLPPPVRVILVDILVNRPLASKAYENYRNYAAKNGIGQSLTQFHSYLKELDTIGLINKERHGHGRGKGVDMRLTVKPEIAATIALSLESEPELIPPRPTPPPPNL